MRRLRTPLIVAALAGLACLVAIGLRPGAPGAAETAGRPSFSVRVDKPRSARPLFGLLPAGDLGFDQASRGAAIGRVGHDHLELSAEGWSLSIEVDGQGRIAPATRLVFPLELGGKDRRLRCRPADPPVGSFRVTTAPGSGRLGGRFLVELATCENIDTGRRIEWPPRPLTVRGRVDGILQSE